jgi:hypothetical protein
MKNNNLKEYTKYLIDIYKKINNKHYENSRVYCDLNEFYQTSRIQDILSKNTKISIKIDILNLYQKDICKFCIDFNLHIDIKKFDEWINTK